MPFYSDSSKSSSSSSNSRSSSSSNRRQEQAVKVEIKTVVEGVALEMAIKTLIGCTNKLIDGATFW